jgi:hypothetical protein
VTTATTATTATRPGNHPARMMPADPVTASVTLMTNSRDPERAFRLNSRPLIVGGVLMGLGGVLGLAGIVVSGACLASAARDWANRQEVPPTELARHHWARAKAATVAGAATWRNGTQEHATPLA